MVSRRSTNGVVLPSPWNIFCKFVDYETAGSLLDVLLKGIPAEIINLLKFLVGNIQPGNFLFKPFPRKRLIVAKHGFFVAGKLYEVVSKAFRLEHRGSGGLADLLGGTELEQSHQNERHDRTDKANGSRGSGSRHDGPNPRSSPTCVTSPICSNALFLPLYHSIQRPFS